MTLKLFCIDATQRFLRPTPSISKLRPAFPFRIRPVFPGTQWHVTLFGPQLSLFLYVFLSFTNTAGFPLPRISSSLELSLSEILNCLSKDLTASVGEGPYFVAQAESCVDKISELSPIKGAS